MDYYDGDRLVGVGLIDQNAFCAELDLLLLSSRHARTRARCGECAFRNGVRDEARD
jgi:hypothetical protein